MMRRTTSRALSILGPAALVLFASPPLVGCLGLADTVQCQTGVSQCEESTNLSWLAALANQPLPGTAGSSGDGTSGAGAVTAGSTTVAPAGAEARVQIKAAEGGTVALGSEVTLTIPPGSLAEDTEITIVKEAQAADAENGRRFAGQAYRFGPAGTEFSIDKPAVLQVRYDPAVVAAQGLASSTQSLMFYDEEQKSYVGVPTTVNEATGIMSAPLEHFTLYVSTAITLASGLNNPPNVVYAGTIPGGGGPRAGAPLYVRAQVRDYDLAGSVAIVRLTATRLQDGAQYNCTMTPEVTTPNRFVCLVPATFFRATDIGPGDDLRISIQAWDHLNAASAPVVRNFNVGANRRYVPGSLVAQLNTGTVLTAGFQALVRARAQDTGGANFPVIPETVVAPVDPNSLVTLGSLGQKSGAGTVLLAEKIGQGPVEVAFAGEPTNGSLNVTVVGGVLQTVKVFDATNPAAKVEITQSPLKIKEGRMLQFDIIGYDQFGNQISILPDWAVEPDPSGPGTVGSTSLADRLENGMHQVRGLLFTLDGTPRAGPTFGHAVARFGGVDFARQLIQVLPRSWVTTGNLSLLPAPSGPQGQHNHDYPTSSGTSSGRLSRMGPADALFVFREEVSYCQYRHYADSCAHCGFGICSIICGPVPLFHCAGGYSSSNLRARRYAGGAWNNLAAIRGNANSGCPVAADPSAVRIGSTDYVAFTEFTACGSNPRVRVVQYNEAANSWSDVGNHLNVVSGDSQRAHIASDGISPWVAWSEMNSATNRWQLFVSRWNAGAWQQRGFALNVDTSKNAHQPALAFDGTTPYVAWREESATAGVYHIHVRRWNGAAWVAVGGGPANTDPTLSADEPSLGVARGVLYLTFAEIDGSSVSQVYVRRLDTGTNSWVTVGPGPINVDVTAGGQRPQIAIRDFGIAPFGIDPMYQIVYVGWQETGGPRVAHWNPFSGQWIVDAGDGDATGIFGGLAFIGGDPFFSAARNGYQQFVVGYQ